MQPDTGWAPRLWGRARHLLRESVEIHRRLWSLGTLKVLAVGVPLSLLAGRYADQTTHALSVRISENYTALAPVFLGGAIFRITLVILYIYSLQPSGYVVAVASGLASTLVCTLTYSIFSSSIGASPLAELLAYTLPAEIAAFGAVDAIVSRRFVHHLFIHTLFLLAGFASPRVLSFYVAGASAGAAYALAAQSLARSRREEQERLVQAEYERKRAENERRASLPLTDNLRIIVQQTPTAKLPVAIDFPRLANKMEVVAADGQVLVPLVRDSVKTAERQMRDILLHLAHCTAAPDVAQCVETRFNECFETENGAVAKSLDRLTARFLSGEFLAENCRPVLILRACNQAAISPAVLALKTSIGQKLPYKDIRGEWWIRVAFAPDAVHVTHEKREQSWTTKPGLEFQFLWELRISFSADLAELRSTSLRIKEVTFADAAPQEYRQGVLEQMRAYYRPNEA